MRPQTGAAFGMLMLGALAAGSANCSQERAPIDQTQPARIDKHFFLGADLRSALDDPEFYINSYVVDAPASQSLVPVGTYDNVDRIRWEVQEDLLIGRKAYEFITNADGHGVRGPTETGIIVAAYRITSQFDVRHAYNPSTGEELNVLVENMTDRPWYNRDYMRVDWSQNLVSNPDWSELFYGSLFGEISFQPVRYYEQDPTSPNFPNFCEMTANTVRAADGSCVTSSASNHPGGYFDVTSKWLVNPETSNAFGEPLPTCLVVNFFSGSGTFDCNPQETTIRTSFRRVEDHDFEPLELTNAPYDLVGSPRATRNGWDQGYGAVDQNFHRYSMLHNLWQHSHLDTSTACTSNLDLNQDGTADQCTGAGFANSQCDLSTQRCTITCSSNDDTNHNGSADQCERAAAGHPGTQCDLVTQRCTMPYREREVRPSVYYVNPQMPPEFQDHLESAPDANGHVTYSFPTAGASNVIRGASEQIIASWNISISSALAHAREVECRRTGGARDACHSRYFANDLVPQEDGAFLGAHPNLLDQQGHPINAVVLCHNPVRQGDPSQCREVGYSVRLGDIRYNHLDYWSGDSRAPFGGIAHWGYDPLTGEVVSNGAFNMGRSVDYAANQQRDYIRLIINSIDPTLDPMTLDQFVTGAPAAVLAQHIRNPAGGVTPISAAELNDRINAVDHHAAASSLAGANVPSFGSNVRGALDWHTNLTTQQVAPVGTVSQTAVNYQGLARQLQNTPIENQLIDSHWLVSAGFAPNTQLDQATMDMVSPLRNFDPETANNMRTRLMSAAEARGFCFTDTEAPAFIGSVDLQGVARWFLNKYRTLTPLARAERIRQDLRIEAFKGIAIHEVGHSLGLLHLPVSSYDSMNYNPQYWQLRTHEGTTADNCRPNASPMGPGASIRNADRNNDNCMGPRYVDPETDEELGVAASANPHAGINYFANTSVMEYQWERFDETIGLGQYDLYAMGILYGRVAETFDTESHTGLQTWTGMTPDEQRAYSPRLQSQLPDLDQIYWGDPALGATTAGNFPSIIHYTELARQLHVFDPARCRDATQAEKDRYRWRLVDGKICSPAPRDVASLTDLETTGTFNTDEAQGDPTRPGISWRVAANAPANAGVGNVRWAYRVAWDIGTGYPHINYFDQGADLYEVSQSIMRKYNLSYPSQYFRRSNREYAYWGIANGIAGRIFKLLRGYHWSVARDVALYSTLLNDATYSAISHDENFLEPYVATESTLFDFFSGVMLRPEVGDFAPSTDYLTPELNTAHQQIFDAQTNITGDPAFTLGVIDGRYIGEQFDNSAGGSWDYQHWLQHAGAYEEKPFAAIMLTDTRPTFSSISRSLYLDGREYQVNFYTDLPQAFDRLLGGVLSEDWATTAMYVPASARGTQATPQMLSLWQANPTRPSDALMAFPNIGYRQELPTIIYSMLFSSLNSDLNTVHKLRIFTEGGPEAVDIPDAERVRFYNPETGITYVSRRYGTDPALTTLTGGRQVDRGIGSRMLAHANALLSATYVTTGTNPDGSMIVSRDTNGNPLPRLATNAQAQAQAETRYRNYVGLIDAARNVARYLGYGTLN